MHEYRDHLLDYNRSYVLLVPQPMMMYNTNASHRYILRYREIERYRDRYRSTIQERLWNAANVLLFYCICSHTVTTKRGVIAFGERGNCKYFNK